MDLTIEHVSKDLESVARVEKRKLTVPPSGLKPHAIAIAFKSSINPYRSLSQRWVKLDVPNQNPPHKLSMRRLVYASFLQVGYS